MSNIAVDKFVKYVRVIGSEAVRSLLEKTVTVITFWKDAEFLQLQQALIWKTPFLCIISY